MYANYMDPYKEPTNMDIARFNSFLREKIFGKESGLRQPSQDYPKVKSQPDNNKMMELPDSDMFEYVPF